MTLVSSISPSILARRLFLIAGLTKIIPFGVTDGKNQQPLTIKYHDSSNEPTGEVIFQQFQEALCDL